MEKIFPFLDTYRGRDRVLRLLCYLSKCAAGLVKSPNLASQYDNFSRQLSTSRACFRLLDDIPTIKHVLSYINSKKEETSTGKIVSVVQNTIDVIFNIFDHVSWAIEHRIIISDNSMWDTASTVCWVLSLYITIYKVSMKLSTISKQKLEMIDLNKKRELNTKLAAEQWHLQMTVLKCLADLLFAISYLPEGFLWSKFFSKWQVGALGSFSSVVSLYQALVL